MECRGGGQIRDLEHSAIKTTRMPPLARPPSPAGARPGGARPASRPAPAGRLILAQAGARPDGAVAPTPAPVVAPPSAVHAAAAARRAAAEAR